MKQVRDIKITAQRRICFRCGQWTEYGTSMIGPCYGSDFQDTRRGHRDPLHEWCTVVSLKVINNALRYKKANAGAA